MQPQERGGEFGIGDDGVGEGDIGQEIGLGIACEVDQVGDLDDDEPR